MLANQIELARFNMVAQQIRPCEVIDDRVLDTLAKIPRERFVPKAYVELAFADVHVPLTAEQYMMKPLQEARMLQALAITSSDRILEIGTGSGFVTACLASLGAAVTSYECIRELSEAAGARLAALDLRNVELQIANPLQSLPSAQFDVIAVTGSLPCYDERLEDLLAPGGRLFVVVGQEPIMCATLVTRDTNGGIWKETLYETHIPALIGTREAERFQF